MRPSAPSATLRSVDERGGIIVGWLTRLTLVFGVAGIFLFDAISVGSTAMQLSDTGTLAAREASEVWQQTGNVQTAYDAAVAQAKEQNEANVIPPKSFTIDAENTVHLTIRRTAPSLLLHRWDRTADWAKISRESRGQSVG